MDNKINKKDLISWIKAKNETISPTTLEKLVDAFFDEISTALVCGDRVELRGFGSMVVKKRKGKVARNPKTNQTIEVGHKGSLYFRASRELIKRLNLDTDKDKSSLRPLAAGK